MSNEKPLVSVLMSCYNAEKYIDEAINSLINQTYNNIEFIFVDDGSTDATLSKLQSFSDNRIQLISHENKGIVKALNGAISSCKGKYIARMDADDICTLDRIEKQVKFLERSPEISACGGAIDEFNEKGFIKRTNKPTNPTDLLFFSLHRAPISNPTSMIRTTIFTENHLNYDPIYKYGQDVKLWSEIAKVGLLANLPDVLLQYRRSLNHISTKHRAEQKSLANIVRADTYKFINEKFTDLNSVSVKNQYWYYKYMAKCDIALNKKAKTCKIVNSSLPIKNKVMLLLTILFAKNKLSSN